MSGGLGEPGPRVAVSGGQGVQVGDHNTQVNYIGAPGFVVPVTVAVKDPEPVFAAAGIDRFTGREWLAGEVDRFIAEHPGHGRARGDGRRVTRGNGRLPVITGLLVGTGHRVLGLR